ncbi:hypothetical protein HFN63_37080 [Rhizobium leguminosarum]|uniref:hypothetical protein n=1 Tax=Rhizobium leguminosarum TaxID=384 RepID=UPI001C96A420|nr:hypothetical protein [Rhizobium leguminosarum]MBY5775516.1 hypothetical protein [Rhizobium leguminosarum]
MDYFNGARSASDPLPLPGVNSSKDDLVSLKDEVAGEHRSELKYMRFCVKMLRSRKIPLFSACNIDGKLSDREDIERTDVWRRDSRIDNRYQNLSEA